MYDTDTQRAYLCHDVLHGMGVVQHKGDGQMRPAQLIHLARKLDGGQRVAAQLGEAAAAISHVHSLDPQRQGGCLRSPDTWHYHAASFQLHVAPVPDDHEVQLFTCDTCQRVSLTLLNIVTHSHPFSVPIRA